jgi:ABC-type dipeptide/oligopeptide/nickel transport system permease component
MIGYIVRRIFQTLPLLFAIVTIIFFALRTLPADPAMAVLGDNASAQSLKALREEMGLNRPLYVQYFSFLGGLVRGDLGNSIITDESVAKMIMQVFPYSAVLAGASILIACIIGIPNFSLLGISTPGYYLGVLLLLAFSLKFRIFPTTGAGEWGDPMDVFEHLVLPAFSLGIVNASLVMRVSRSTMLDVLNEDYIRTARSKGLKESIVVYKHALRNALLPVVTIIGVYIGVILGTAVLTEMVFSRPGLGRLLISAVNTRDYPVIQSSLIVFSCSVALINLLTDLSYAFINPQVKFD